jgi:hypothetical protein
MAADISRRRSMRPIAAATLFAIAVLLPGFTRAEEKKSDPCAAESARFCKDVSSKPEVMRCLEEHTAELSKPCRRRVERARDRAHRASGGCAEDRAKFCAGVKPGGGAMGKCLRANEEKLSASCQASLRRKKACRDDVAKFCASVEKGGGRIAACLRAHTAELSADCKATLARSS